jgi:hypothetical protein
LLGGEAQSGTPLALKAIYRSVLTEEKQLIQRGKYDLGYRKNDPCSIRLFRTYKGLDSALLF